MGYCPWGRKESNMTQQLSTHTRGNCVFNSLKKFVFFFAKFSWLILLIFPSDFVYFYLNIFPFLKFLFTY